MAIKFMNPADAVRLLELSSKPDRPQRIVELEMKIKTETALLAKALSETGQMPGEEIINAVVSLRPELDTLYCFWAEGKLS